MSSKHPSALTCSCRCRTYVVRPLIGQGKPSRKIMPGQQGDGNVCHNGRISTVRHHALSCKFNWKRSWANAKTAANTIVHKTSITLSEHFLLRVWWQVRKEECAGKYMMEVIFNVALCSSYSPNVVAPKSTGVSLQINLRYVYRLKILLFGNLVSFMVVCLDDEVKLSP